MNDKQNKTELLFWTMQFSTLITRQFQFRFYQLAFHMIRKIWHELTTEGYHRIQLAQAKETARCSTVSEIWRVDSRVRYLFILTPFSISPWI